MIFTKILKKLPLIRIVFDPHRRFATPLIKNVNFLVSSYRLPFKFVKDSKGSTERQNRVGGMLTSLEPLVVANNAVWIGWPGEFYNPGMVFPEKDLKDASQEKKITLDKIFPVDLRKVDHERFISCCNKSLWPVFHSFIDKASFVDDNWKAYVAVNNEFCNTIYDYIDNYTDNVNETLILLNDYHIILSASELKNNLKKNKKKTKIGIFCHVPFPPAGIFRIIPWCELLLEGFLACDVIAFNSMEYVSNFIDCCSKYLNCKVRKDKAVVQFSNHIAKIISLPISVPLDLFKKLAELSNPEIISGNIIVGVDRVDYIKGIPQKLKAFELFLDLYPEYLFQVTLFQIAMPSEAEDDNDVKRQIDAMVGKINGKYGTANWSPVHYMHSYLNNELRAGIFRKCQTAIITSLRDGMNLVAKEYVVCQNDEFPGTLILSEFTGAAEELTGAILANPYSLEDLANKIHRAISMTPDERRVRIHHMKYKIKDNSIWLDLFLESLKNHEENVKNIKSEESALTIEDFDDYFSNYIKPYHEVMLIMDYGGTLVANTSDSKQMPILPSRTKLLIEKLCDFYEKLKIIIISHRNVIYLMNMVECKQVCYAGYNGLEVVIPTGQSFNHPKLPVILQKTDELAISLKSKVCKDGARLKNKEYCLHYLFNEVKNKKRKKELVNETIKLAKNSGFHVISYMDHLEIILPAVWNKGEACMAIITKHFGYEWNDKVRIIYCGDAEKDEDAFKVLKDIGITFQVSQAYLTKTAADKRIPSIDSVATLLQWFIKFYENTKKLK